MKSDMKEPLWYICCGTLTCEQMDMDMTYPHETITNSTRMMQHFIFILLLAVFAFDTKHHALVTNLARLGEPGLC